MGFQVWGFFFFFFTLVTGPRRSLNLKLSGIWGLSGVVHAASRVGGFHLETLIIYKLGFNQNYYTFTSILLIKIVLCSNFH